MILHACDFPCIGIDKQFGIAQAGNFNLPGFIGLPDTQRTELHRIWQLTAYTGINFIDRQPFVPNRNVHPVMLRMNQTQQLRLECKQSTRDTNQGKRNAQNQT